jgi:hypothetical protein
MSTLIDDFRDDLEQYSRKFLKRLCKKFCPRENTWGFSKKRLEILLLPFLLHDEFTDGSGKRFSRRKLLVKRAKYSSKSGLKARKELLFKFGMTQNGEYIGS